MDAEPVVGCPCEGRGWGDAALVIPTSAHGSTRGRAAEGGAGMTDTLSSDWREHVPVERGQNHSVAGQAALKRTATYAVGSVGPLKPKNPDPHDALSSSLLRALPI